MKHTSEFMTMTADEIEAAFFESSEAIARGEPCPECGRTWYRHSHDILILRHDADCLFLAAATRLDALDTIDQALELIQEQS